MKFLLYFGCLLGALAVVDAADGVFLVKSRPPDRGYAEWKRDQLSAQVETDVARKTPTVAALKAPLTLPQLKSNPPQNQNNPSLSDHLIHIEQLIDEKVTPAMQKGWEDMTKAIQNAVDKTQNFWHTVPGYLQTVAPAISVFVNISSLLVMLSILYSIRQYTRTVRRIARRETGQGLI